MDKRIIYKIYVFLKDLNVEFIRNCLTIMNHYFVPAYMSGKSLSRGKRIKFNEKKFFNNLQNDITQGISINLHGADNAYAIWISQDAYEKDIVTISIIMRDDDREFVETFVEEVMKNKGIVSCVSSLEDDNLQNTQEIDMYKLMRGDSRHVKLIRNSHNEEIIDLEANPGHEHVGNGIWFGSCYKMWFGKEYYHYISKDKLKNFKNCHENVELENDVIRITLYQDIWAYNESQNRMIQWDFRNTVEMDKVAHSLEKSLKEKAVDADPEIEIIAGNSSDGESKLIKYYYDEKGNLTQKSKAKKVRSWVR